MKHASLTIIALLVLLPAGLPAAGPLKEVAKVLPADALGTGRLVPDVAFTTLSGEAGRLADVVKQSPFTVVALTSISCPLCGKFAPVLAALEDEWKGRGVQFLYVNPLDKERMAMAADVKARGFDGAYVPDDDGALAAALQAQSTAEVFLLDAGRTLLYRGAVDDQYGIGYQKSAPEVSWLRDALEAVTAGRRPVIAATTAPGCALDLERGKLSAADAGKALTWHGRVSRIVQNRCQECHHDGGVAPFALENRDDVLTHAGMIRKVVDRGIMPPWYASGDEPRGHWANDRSLSEDDRRDLLAWLAGDRAEGNPADAAPPRQWPDGWTIGTPDAVISLPEDVPVKASGRMPYINLAVKTDFPEDRWVQAIEVRPTALAQVHHVLVFVVPKEKAGKRGAGAGEGDEFFAAWVPGCSHLQYPDGYAKKLPAGATIAFQLHYTPNGTATVDRTRLGLGFAPEPPRYEVKVAATKAPRLTIPAGDANYSISGELPVPFPVQVLAFMPHMHVRGKAYRYELISQGGERSTLLDVPHYDFNWQLQYRLAEPLVVPAGSRLRGTAWYDNSAANPANPDPSKTVRWGPQTEDEMMLGYLEYVRTDLPVTAGTAPAETLALTPKALESIGRRLDKDGDGRISRAEAGKGFARLHERLDADRDGYVTRNEVAAALARRAGS